MEDDLRYLIIEEVERNRCLWDKDDEFYKNSLFRTKAWMNIAELCSTSSKKYTVQEVQKIWRSIRDRANKIDKNRHCINPTGSAAKDYDDDDYEDKDDDWNEKWKFWPSVQFLFGESGMPSERTCSLTMFNNKPINANAARSSARQLGDSTITSSGKIPLSSEPAAEISIFKAVDEHSYLSPAMQHRRNLNTMISSSAASPPKVSDHAVPLSPGSEFWSTTPLSPGSGSSLFDQRKRKLGGVNETRASTSGKECASGSKQRKGKPGEGDSTLDEILARMIGDEFAAFGNVAADTLRRANVKNPDLAKKCKLDIMQLLMDLEAAV